MEIAIYIAGAVIAYGYTGGIRDEMDGIADIAVIAFWPVALLAIAVCKSGLALAGIGKSISGRR